MKRPRFRLACVAILVLGFTSSSASASAPDTCCGVLSGVKLCQYRLQSQIAPRVEACAQRRRVEDRIDNFVLIVRDPAKTEGTLSKLTLDCASRAIVGVVDRWQRTLGKDSRGQFILADAVVVSDSTSYMNRSLDSGGIITLQWLSRREARQWVQSSQSLVADGNADKSTLELKDSYCEDGSIRNGLAWFAPRVSQDSIPRIEGGVIAVVLDPCVVEFPRRNATVVSVEKFPMVTCWRADLDRLGGAQVQFVEDILMHEYGHSLGLDNTPEEFSVMHSTIRSRSQNQPSRPTELDRGEVRRIYQLGR